MTTTVTIKVPAGYATAEEFLKDCGFELAHSVGLPSMDERINYAINTAPVFDAGTIKQALMMAGFEIVERGRSSPQWWTGIQPCGATP